MTREQKQAELNIKDTDRCMIAPYIVRLALLDRLIAATASEMKQHPARRELVTDKEIEFRSSIHFCRWEKGKDSTTENDDEATPHPFRIAKRPREMSVLKDGLLAIDIPGKKKKNLLLKSRCSINKAPSTGNDILFSDLQLSRVWLMVKQNPASSWLAWTYNNSEFAIYNDDRFRRMVKTQRDMAHDNQDNESDPVYQLALRNGVYPEDQDEW